MVDKETAVALRESSITDLTTVSKLFADSGYFPDAKSVAQAFVKIQTGRELGIPAMAAMTGINIIQGKPVAGANIIAAKVKMSGYDYRIRKLDNTGCSIEFFNSRGESLGISTFDEMDARNAGLAAKDNWRKYARNMFFARAISNGQRWYCPDATSGQLVYTPDELGVRVNGDGEPIIDHTGNPVMDAQTVPKIDKTKAVDAIFDEPLPEPPAWMNEPTPYQEKESGTITPEQLVELSDEEMIFGWRDMIASATGETPDAVMKRIATFTGKDGNTQYTLTLKKKDGNPISDKWLKAIKHDMRIECEKHFPPNDSLPF